MKYYLIPILLLCFFYTNAQTKLNHPIPGIHDFVAASEEATPLNLNEIIKEMGYPETALRAGIEGKVVCRVLVSEIGEYEEHLVTYNSHPVLKEAVESYMPKLAFKPAQQEGKSIKYWLNIPFSFMIAEQRKNPSRDFEALYDEALEYRKQEKYLTAESYLDRAILLSFHKNPGKKCEFLLNAYSDRAITLFKLHKWGKARTDLTLCIGLAKEYSLLKSQVADFYYIRALLAIRAGNPVAAISDMNWIGRNHPGYHPDVTALDRSPFVSKEEIKELIDYCSNALILQHNSPLMYWTQALCKQKLHDFEGAAMDFESASRVAETLVLSDKAFTAAGIMYLDQKMNGPALSFLVRATEDANSNPKGHFLKGVVLLRLAHIEEGCKSIQNAVHLGLEVGDKDLAGDLLRKNGYTILAGE